MLEELWELGLGDCQDASIKQFWPVRSWKCGEDWASWWWFWPEIGWLDKVEDEDCLGASWWWFLPGRGWITGQGCGRDTGNWSSYSYYQCRLIPASPMVLSDKIRNLGNSLVSIGLIKKTNIH